MYVLSQQPAHQQDNQQLKSTHLGAATRPTARQAAHHLDTAWLGSDRLQIRIKFYFYSLLNLEI